MARFDNQVQLRRPHDIVWLLAVGTLSLYLLIALLVLSGFVGQQWDQATVQGWAAPSIEHWLGTNRIGQDIRDRVFYGAMTAVSIGLSVGFLSVLFGSLAGALAAFYENGVFDHLLQSLMNMIDAIPFYLLVILLSGLLENLAGSTIFAMIFCFWTTSARVIRSEVIQMKENEYMKIAQLLNLNVFRRLLIHMLPNMKGLLLTQFIIVFVVAIKTEVALSFLGFGAVSGVSWGVMVAESVTDFGSGQPYNLIAPTAALFLLVLCLNVVLHKSLLRQS